MPRTNAALVREIIEVEDGVSLSPFISAANILVTAKCAVHASYTALELMTIETWLAAHFYTVYDPRTVQEQARSVQATYQSKVDLGLDTSHYGQMAKRLDYKGGLAAMDNSLEEIVSRTVGLKWLGKE